MIYKFRTMRPATDAFPEGADDAERLAAFGRFLRASSLDELPEIVNVLRGDMSWVGPRPLLMDHLGRYTAEQARRHEVPPGITGLAQVGGRNQLSWEQKFKLDVYYVDRWSVWLDMRILLRTLGQTITRRGIRADGHATAPAFRPAVSEPSRGERR